MKRRKIIAFVLSVAMIAGSLPTMVLAEGETIESEDDAAVQAEEIVSEETDSEDTVSDETEQADPETQEEPEAEEAEEVEDEEEVEASGEADTFNEASALDVQNAIDALQPGDSYTIPNDLDIVVPLYVKKPGVTINLDGHTLNGNGSAVGIFCVQANLVKIVNGKIENASYYGVELDGDGLDLTLDGVEISGVGKGQSGSDQFAIKNSEGQIITLKDCTIKENKTVFY